MLSKKTVSQLSRHVMTLVIIFGKILNNNEFSIRLEWAGIWKCTTWKSAETGLHQRDCWRPPAELLCRMQFQQRQPRCDCIRKSNICSRSMCGSSLRLLSYLPSPSLQFGQEQATRRSLLLGGPSCSEELCTVPSCSGLMEEPDATLPTATVTGDD